MSCFARNSNALERRGNPFDKRGDCFASLAKQLILDCIYMVYSQYYIYIMTNENNTTLYTGVTNDLKRRIYEHREKLIKGFTRKYNVNKLVYYEVFDDIDPARLRENQIKAGSRKNKISLINSMNNSWRDLYDEL